MGREEGGRSGTSRCRGVAASRRRGVGSATPGSSTASRSSSSSSSRRVCAYAPETALSCAAARSTASRPPGPAKRPIHMAAPRRGDPNATQVTGPQATRGASSPHPMRLAGAPPCRGRFPRVAGRLGTELSGRSVKCHESCPSNIFPNCPSAKISAAAGRCRGRAASRRRHP